MANSQGAMALSFHNTRFDLVDHSTGQPWLRSRQIAGALGYAQPDAITDLYNSNAAEFTPSMTDLVKLPTAGGTQEVRIFSLRGAHLLGMFARTERAAEFRRWVLDVLEQQAAAPAPAPVPQLVGQTFERVVAERDALRAMLADRVLKEEPELRKVLYYYAIEGLPHRERSLLVGWKSTDRYLEALKRLATLGLVEYEPDAALAANGRRNIVKLRERLAAGALPPPQSWPKGHPSRSRPNAGRTAEQLNQARAIRAQRKKGGAA